MTEKVTLGEAFTDKYRRSLPAKVAILAMVDGTRTISEIKHCLTDMGLYTNANSAGVSLHESIRSINDFTNTLFGHQLIVKETPRSKLSINPHLGQIAVDLRDHLLPTVQGGVPTDLMTDGFKAIYDIEQDIPVHERIEYDIRQAKKPIKKPKANLKKPIKKTTEQTTDNSDQIVESPSRRTMAVIDVVLRTKTNSAADAQYDPEVARQRQLRRLGPPKSERKGFVRSGSGRKKRPGNNSGVNEDLMREYLVDIAQHPLLTKEQERELARAYRDGLEAYAELCEIVEPDEELVRVLLQRIDAGNAAEKKFVQSNLRLVVSIAKKYQSSGVALLDLIQEGNMGLMHAVEKFDETKGFKFSTYATWWIKQAITRSIANTSRLIRLPVHANDALVRILKARNRLESQNNGHAPTIAQIAEETELSEAVVIRYLNYTREPLSLDAPIREDADSNLGDFVVDRTSSVFSDDVVERHKFDGDFERIRDVLQGRELEIIERRFGMNGYEPQTLEQVGEAFNLTRERIRQIEARALAKLRHPTSGIRA